MAKNDRRLIDANQLPKHRLEIKDTGRPEPYIFDVVFLAYLEKAETVDAVEVVHGRNQAEDTPSRFECSVCGWTDWDTYTADSDEYNYCPGCGAKMDGGPGNAEN